MQLFELDEGTSFLWKSDTYVILEHTDDNTIVERTCSGDRVIADEHRHKENFNPYADVTPVLRK